MLLSRILVRSLSEREGFIRGGRDVLQAWPRAPAAQSASATAVQTLSTVSVVSIYVYETVSL
jgi:hypothetical protein